MHMYINDYNYSIEKLLMQRRDLFFVWKSNKVSYLKQQKTAYEMSSFTPTCSPRRVLSVFYNQFLVVHQYSFVYMKPFPFGYIILANNAQTSHVFYAQNSFMRRLYLKITTNNSSFF